MWQYSDKGRVNGINGDVDMDEMYVDYPSIIIQGGYNNYPKQDGADSVDSVDATANSPEKQDNICKITLEYSDGTKRVYNVS